MLQTAQRNDALAQLPIGNPDPVPKKVWRKKKAHGPAELNSAKIAHRDLLAKKRLKGPQTEQPITRQSLLMTKDPGLYSGPPPKKRLEESGSTKRTDGRTLDSVALSRAL
jgi:hypothetical protein